MNEPDVFLYVITEQALHDSTATILHTDRYEYSPAINVSQYSFSNSPPDPGLHHEPRRARKVYHPWAVENVPGSVGT
jgi:hypothetical protein